MTPSNSIERSALVTGAAGFIGFHLSRRLLEIGWDVVGIDNLNDYYDPSLKRARLEIIEKDERYFELVDTGGYGIVEAGELTEHIERQI